MRYSGVAMRLTLRQSLIGWILIGLVAGWLVGKVARGAGSGCLANVLLENFVGRGVRADRRRLFVIDGSKALGAGIEVVFGTAAHLPRKSGHSRKKRRSVAEPCSFGTVSSRVQSFTGETS